MSRNVTGTVEDRSGTPLRHALTAPEFDLEAAVGELTGFTPIGTDEVIVRTSDGTLYLVAIEDLPVAASVSIFDILSGSTALTVSQPSLETADITLTVVPGAIDHDALLNGGGNDHIDHTAVVLTAGVALSGGGDISSSRTFNLDITELVEDTNPEESADFIATYDNSAAAHKKVKFSNIDHDGLTNGAGNKHIDHTAVTLTAGSGLSGGGDISSNRTFDIDITELS